MEFNRSGSVELGVPRPTRNARLLPMISFDSRVLEGAFLPRSLLHFPMTEKHEEPSRVPAMPVVQS